MHDLVPVDSLLRLRFENNIDVDLEHSLLLQTMAKYGQSSVG